MGYYDRNKLRSALGDFAVEAAASHHVTAMLRSGLSKTLLEATLYEWVNRVNRQYLGRNWYRPDRKTERMWGLVFFELGRSGNDPHAHLVVRPPTSADLLHFEKFTPLIFASSRPPGQGFSLAPGGTMKIQRMGSSEEHTRRVVGYDTKEMEHRPQAYEEWKTIDDLSALSAGR